MAEGRIRWKQSDYLALGRAVANFNKQVKKLETEENKNYLPELRDYSLVKENITTRRELNRVLKSLRKFKEEGQAELFENDAGQKMTVWEKNEIQRNIKVGLRRLNAELKQLKNNPEYPLGSDEIDELEARIKNLKKFNELKGYDFKRLRERAYNIGRDDYKMVKAIRYRENYMKVLERYADFDNYDALVNYLDKFQNPLKFFDVMKNTRNDNTIDLTYVSDEHFTQQAFNNFVKQFINLDETNEVVN